MAEPLHGPNVGGYTSNRRRCARSRLRGAHLVRHRDAPRIAGSRLLLLPEAMHCSPVEQADAFDRALQDFLAGAG